MLSKITGVISNNQFNKLNMQFKESRNGRERDKKNVKESGLEK